MTAPGYFKFDECGLDDENAKKLFGGKFDIHAFHEYCYATNNRYAYLYDKNGVEPLSESKHSNFVPTYDKWCLNCNRGNCHLRCSRCKFIYFCDEKCQRAAWPIHKKHCGRDLFCRCATCGVQISDDHIKCSNCPVKFCGQQCYNKLYKPHVEYDCKTFAGKK